jgi:hypothetical protein
VVDDGEEFPGKLACDNGGFMKKVVESSNLISQMQDYYDFLTANTQSTSDIKWSPPYLDALGLGLMVTAAVPVVTNRYVFLVFTVGHSIALGRTDLQLSGLKNLD